MRMQYIGAKLITMECWHKVKEQLFRTPSSIYLLYYIYNNSLYASDIGVI